MSKQNGFTLIELILFIVIVGIALAGVMLPLSYVLEKSPNPISQVVGIAYAQGRMELQIGQRRLGNYTNYNGNLCTGYSQPANCSLNNYTASVTYPVQGGYSWPIQVQITDANNNTVAQLYTNIGTYSNGSY